MSWLLKLLFKALAEMLIGAAEVLADYINNIFSRMYKLQQKLHFDAVNEYIETIALSLVAVFVIKELFTIYVLRIEGDSDEDPLTYITKSCVTIMYIRCGSFIIQKLVEYASILTNEVTKKLFEESSYSSVLKTVATTLTGGGTVAAFVILIFLVISLIAMIVYIFKAAKRAAELMIFQITLPLFALNNLTSSREIWKPFSMDLIVCIFGYVIQVFGFNVFMKLFALYGKEGSVFNSEYLFASFGWLLVVLMAPKWLEKYLHHTGVGSALKGGMRGTSNVLVQAVGRKVWS